MKEIAMLMIGIGIGVHITNLKWRNKEATKAAVDEARRQSK